jgi:uncharacterized protein YjiS (DUF1127 family)
MFNFSAIAGNGYHRYMTYVARKQAMQVLVRQSDTTLRDIGISRELLNSGLAGWPWHAPETNTRRQHLAQGSSIEARGLTPVQIAGRTTVEGKRSRFIEAYHNMVSRARAIRELRQMSDRELSDLGITRSTIVEAVTHGRSGVERPHPQQPAAAGVVHNLNSVSNNGFNSALNNAEKNTESRAAEIDTAKAA